MNPQVILQDKGKDTILEYCKEPRSKKEIAEYCGYRDVRSFASGYLRPLLDEGKQK